MIRAVMPTIVAISARERLPVSAIAFASSIVNPWGYQRKYTRSAASRKIANDRSRMNRDTISTFASLARDCAAERVVLSRREYRYVIPLIFRVSSSEMKHNRRMPNVGSKFGKCDTIDGFLSLQI